MVSVLTSITRLFDLLFAPFARMSPWVGLAVASALSGAVLLLVFRYTSSQRGLRAAKDRVIGHLLEVVLYRDDPRVVLRAQARLLRDNLRYLAYTLVPLIFMVLPAVLLIIQLDLRYGRRPLHVGERTIVAVKLRPAAASLDEVSIAAPPGIEVDTPALRLPSEHEVDWRVVARKPGVHALRLRVGGQQIVKRLVVEERGGLPAQERAAAEVRAQFLHPGEAPLPRGAPVAWVRVTYPPATLPLFGRHVYWFWPWLVIAMVAGYALRGPLRVQL